MATMVVGVDPTIEVNAIVPGVKALKRNQQNTNRNCARNTHDEVLALPTIFVGRKDVPDVWIPSIGFDENAVCGWKKSTEEVEDA